MQMAINKVMRNSMQITDKLKSKVKVMVVSVRFQLILLLSSNFDSTEHDGFVPLKIKKRIDFTMDIRPSISKD